jgi:hypothetical protein
VTGEQMAVFVIASEAKQSSGCKVRLDCFVAEFIIGPAKRRTRWLLAMTEWGTGVFDALA